jgi:hypothetical protein
MGQKFKNPVLQANFVFVEPVDQFLRNPQKLFAVFSDVADSMDIVHGSLQGHGADRPVLLFRGAESFFARLSVPQPFPKNVPEHQRIHQSPVHVEDGGLDFVGHESLPPAFFSIIAQFFSICNNRNKKDEILFRKGRVFGFFPTFASVPLTERNFRVIITRKTMLIFRRRLRYVESGGMDRL